MLKRSDGQFIFSKNVAVFLHWLTVHHIKWTIGEVWRRAPTQKWLLKKGWTRVLKGQHTKKKAIDISIYLENELYAPLKNIPENYDLIITDQTMPKVLGSELAIRMLDIRKDIPIILITGYSPLISQKDIKEIGKVDLLTSEDLNMPLIW